MLANVLPCDSIYESVLANFRLSPPLFSNFFSGKKGGKAGIAPWKLARLEKGEDSRKLKPACRRRQLGRGKFDLDFSRDCTDARTYSRFHKSGYNSVLTRRLIRKGGNGSDISWR